MSSAGKLVRVVTFCFFSRYVCPKCDPHSKQNYPNLKKLNRADHELIRKTFKAIKQNRHSQQFMEPVDQRENPKYYEIVKEPMGKKLVLNLQLNTVWLLSIQFQISQSSRPG